MSRRITQDESRGWHCRHDGGWSPDLMRAMRAGPCLECAQIICEVHVRRHGGGPQPSAARASQYQTESIMKADSIQQAAPERGGFPGVVACAAAVVLAGWARKMAHEARTDGAMILGALLLVIAGAGPWSADARIERGSSGP